MELGELKQRLGELLTALDQRRLGPKALLTAVGRAGAELARVGELSADRAAWSAARLEAFERERAQVRRLMEIALERARCEQGDVGALLVRTRKARDRLAFYRGDAHPGASCDVSV
jgi:hypothetical protein